MAVPTSAKRHHVLLALKKLVIQTIILSPAPLCHSSVTVIVTEDGLPKIKGAS